MNPSLLKHYENMVIDGNYKVVKYLLIQFPDLLEHCIEDQYIITEYVAGLGNLDFLEWLYNVFFEDREFIFIPSVLVCAAAAGQLEIFENFRERIDATEEDIHECLMLSIKNEDEDAVQYLLDLYEIDFARFKYTALQLAFTLENDRIIEILQNYKQ